MDQPPPYHLIQSDITQQQHLQMVNTEGRIILALNAYQKNQFSSLQAASRAYNISPTTLTRRSKGTPFRPESRPINLKLTQTEEAIFRE